MKSKIKIILITIFYLVALILLLLVFVFGNRPNFFNTQNISLIPQKYTGESLSQVISNNEIMQKNIEARLNDLNKNSLLSATSGSTTTKEKDIKFKGVLFAFVSNYNYIENPSKKTDQEITKDVMGLANSQNCEGNSGCFKNSDNNKISFTLNPKQEYIYYLAPESFGEISYKDFSGFLVAGFSNNAWASKKINLILGSKNISYNLYAFPSYDQINLGSPTTGALNVTVP